VTLLLLASSSVSAGAGGVYACSGNSFDVTKFDLKTCDASVFKKALRKVSKDLDLPQDTVTALLGDDKPIDWGTGSETKKTQAQIQAEKEAKAKEAERQRLLKMPPNTSDPSWVNASPEDCWGIVKDAPEYGAAVGWGHRNDKHPDPKLRNSCFVYTRKEDGTGMPPFKCVHVSGCHKSGLKLSEGCMTDGEKKYFARMKRMPPKNIDTVLRTAKRCKD
jgi:hypothetical protein